MRDHIVWNVDRTLVDLGFVQIQWYGLLFALAFLVGTLIVRQQLELTRRPASELDGLLKYVLISTIIGARLGHVLFYDPIRYLSNPIEVLMIWEGGLASHGGTIAIAIGLYLFSKRSEHFTYLQVLDMICVPAALGASLIRLGNLFNSEIIGLPSSRPWAVIFQRIDSVPRHPTMIYESAAYLVIFALVAYLFFKTMKRENPGFIFGLFLTTLFGARIAIEITKTQQAAFGLPFGLTMGQILSIPATAIGIWLLVRSAKRLSLVLWVSK